MKRKRLNTNINLSQMHVAMMGSRIKKNKNKKISKISVCNEKKFQSFLLQSKRKYTSDKHTHRQETKTKLFGKINY
jgi:hypothetical protein